jgi:hypothetical protein
MHSRNKKFVKKGGNKEMWTHKKLSGRKTIGMKRAD